MVDSDLVYAEPEKEAKVQRAEPRDEERLDSADGAPGGSQPPGTRWLSNTFSLGLKLKRALSFGAK